jgi:SSS family transporter
MSLAIGPLDLAIIAIYFAGVTALGLWLGRGQKTAADYLLGDRNLPWWAVLLSIVSTETSTVTFLSIPGITFAKDGDMRFLQLTVGYINGRFVIVFLFLPHYFQGNLYTAYDVLHRRFGGAARKTASLLFLVTRNLADGLRLALTALVLQKIFTLDLNVSVAVLGVVTIAYTFAGGMKSVVWTDCFQFGVYILGALLAGGIILQLLPGGWEQLVEFGREQDKFRLLSFSFDLSERYTLAAGLVGGMFLTLATHGADQLMVQRYLAARSQSDAAKALGLSGIVVAAQFALFLLIGVGLACYYSLHPADQPLKNDEAFAQFLITHMPPGILGVTLAAVFAAAMSTLSSSLNSSAAALINDIYAPLRGEKNSERLLWPSRVATVFFGVVQTGVGIVAANMAAGAEDASTINNVLATASFTTGAVLGMFFLGVLTRRVSEKAALWGLLAGLALMAYVFFETKIAWPWYALIGSGTTFVVGVAASMIWPRKHEESKVEESKVEGPRE